MLHLSLADRQSELVRACQFVLAMASSKTATAAYSAGRCYTTYYLVLKLLLAELSRRTVLVAMDFSASSHTCASSSLTLPATASASAAVTSLAGSSRPVKAS